MTADPAATGTEQVRVCAFSVPAAFAVALEGGLFAAEGLAVTVERAEGSKQQLAALGDGTYDLIHTSADNIMKFRGLHGLAARVAGVIELGLAMDLVGSARTGTLEGTRGGTVAVDAEDSGYAFVAYEMLVRAGVGRDEYRAIEVGNPDARASALRDGTADVALLAHGALRAALDDGGRILQRGVDAFPEFPGMTVAAMEHTLDASDTAVRYVRALRSGARIAADPAQRDTVVGHMAAHHGITRDAAADLIDREEAVRTAAAPPASSVRSALATMAELRSRWSAIGADDHYLHDRTIDAVDDVDRSPTA